jgi:hypothetical protein
MVTVKLGPTIPEFILCATMTKDFLKYTKRQGNDLITPNKTFPGLEAGDKWCVCAGRYTEAKNNGIFLPVDWNATHESSKKYPGFSLERFTNTVPCGANNNSLKPKNSMSAKTVLNAFLVARENLDYNTAINLTVNTSNNLQQAIYNLPSNRPSQVTKFYSDQCRIEYIVTYHHDITYIYVLERQYLAKLNVPNPKFKVPPNSLYWRITDIFII